MKKNLLAIGLFLLVLTIVVFVGIKEKIAQKQEIAAFNQPYETYLQKEVYGIDVVTVINKAIDHNTKYAVEKDEQGNYKEDNQQVIKVELKLIASVDEKTGERNIVTHPMEAIQKKGLEGFISNFNLTTFKCSQIEYHKETGKVKKVVFEQIEE